MLKTNSLPMQIVIGGVCSDFVCRCCFTKYGWVHQTWCECIGLNEPSCEDCRYYDPHNRRCGHPVRRKRTEGYGK